MYLLRPLFYRRQFLMSFFDDSIKSKRKRKRNPTKDKTPQKKHTQKSNTTKSTKTKKSLKEPPKTNITFNSIYTTPPPRTRGQLLTWEEESGYFGVYPAHVVLDHILDDAVAFGRSRITHWAYLEEDKKYEE